MKNRCTYTILVISVITLIMAIFTYTQASKEIAIHWDINGTADGYAPKLFLLLIPFLIPLVDLFLILFFHLDPRKKNMQKSTAGYNTMRLLIASVLFTCTIMTCLEALQPGMIKIDTIAPFLMGLMIMIIGNILPKIHSNYTIGIRNRWTLENENIWRRTQRLSGRLWFGSGIVICILSFFITSNFFILSLAIIITIIILPNIYAYYLYQKMRKENIHD